MSGLGAAADLVQTSGIGGESSCAGFVYTQLAARFLETQPHPSSSPQHGLPTGVPDLEHSHLPSMHGSSLLSSQRHPTATFGDP